MFEGPDIGPIQGIPDSAGMGETLSVNIEPRSIDGQIILLDLAKIAKDFGKSLTLPSP